MNNIFHSLVALITPTNDDNEYEFSSSQGKAKNLPISFQHSMLFGAKFWILSGLKEDSVRWVHFNCSLICTFLIIIFSPVSRISDASYHPRRPPSFSSSHRFFFFFFVILFVVCARSPFSLRHARRKTRLYYCELSSIFSADSLTWKFHSNCCAFSSRLPISAALSTFE